MKPGEFVGVKKSYSIECFDGEDWYTVNRTHPDFATAVAALQALIQPSLDPRAGRVLAMREANAARHGEEFVYLSDDWRMRFYDRADHFCGPWDLERRMRDDWHVGVEPGPSIALMAFEAGRRYERERGCAYVSDKPWTHQS
jgi:hypothetical protein